MDLERIKKTVHYIALFLLIIHVMTIFLVKDNQGPVVIIIKTTTILMLVLNALALKSIFFKGFNLKFNIRTIEELKLKNGIDLFFLLIIIFFTALGINFLGNIGAFIFISLNLISVLFSIHFLITNYLKFKEISTLIIGLSIYCVILLHWTRQVYQDYFGEEIIGSFFEKSKYETEYYVNLFSNEKTTKNYRLPAVLEVYEEYVEPSNEDDSGYSLRVIRLKKITFPNKGYLSFTNCDDCQLKIGKKVGVMDNNGNYWHAELTTSKVNNTLK